MQQGDLSYDQEVRDYFADGTGNDWPSSTRVKIENKAKEESYPGLDFKEIWEITPDGPRPRRPPFLP